ncbi:MAG: hypothetical protein ACLFPA_07215 [Dichotomicrobium sp.]
MNLVRIMAIAALATSVSTAAYAGGYSFQSVGGNFGKWAYGDAAANGEAKVHGYKSGETYSESIAETDTRKSFGVTRKQSNTKFEKKTSSQSYGGNVSGFTTEYGMGSAQSHSGAVAGSGVGTGAGFKIGNFEPNGRNFEPNHSN